MSNATPANRRGIRRTLRAISLELQVATRSRHVPGGQALQRCAAAVRLDREYAGASVTVRIVGVPEGRRLNREFRHKDYATNVLTFVYGQDNGVLQGDVVMCAPVVAREARQQGKSLAAHYAHLLVHGLLHLQGLDHENDDEAERMEHRERRILKSLGYANPYAVREPAPAGGRRSIDNA